MARKSFGSPDLISKLLQLYLLWTWCKVIAKKCIFIFCVKNTSVRLRILHHTEYPRILRVVTDPKSWKHDREHQVPPAEWQAAAGLDRKQLPALWSDFDIIPTSVWGLGPECLRGPAQESTEWMKQIGLAQTHEDAAHPPTTTEQCSWLEPSVSEEKSTTRRNTRLFFPSTLTQAWQLNPLSPLFWDKMDQRGPQEDSGTHQSLKYETLQWGSF